MPSQTQRLISLAWILAGVAVIAACVYLSEGAQRPILKQPLALWGAVVFGVVLVGVGVVWWVNAPRSPEEARLRIAENDFIVSLRIWLIAAAADGELRDKEIEVIVQNARACFGREIDDDFVRTTYEIMKKRTGARHIDDELFSSPILLSAEGVKHTLYGAIYVALFDGELDAEERRVIDEIAARLELEREVIDGIIAEVADDVKARTS